MLVYPQPTVTNTRDDNTHLATGNNDILLVVCHTQDDTGTQPVDDDSDNEGSHIDPDSKG